MNRLHAAVVGSIAVASAGVAAFLYYFLMPAWVYVERSPNDEENIATIADDEVARYPILKRLMLKADESYGIVPSDAIEMASKSEATEIANLLALYDEANDRRGSFIYDNKRYYIHIVYQYNPPALA